ncbi:MAG: RNA-binding protein [Cyclobacteriaceae bacterium]|jgi:RNA recognition motif-containing protein|nr:RNA-binding protein [Flammeovirgaceae bacterium]MCZ8020385.1 RNA-binding protein [Cytophagales bacterium]MCZ8328171.1 RNA-binding protein [Cyclobacteriaceae bacterium]
MDLFVANINKTVREDALRALFEEFGNVSSVKILTDKYTGESKGYGFVGMSNENNGLDAIKKLSNAEFFGRKLVVNKAKPKTTAY